MLSGKTALITGAGRGIGKVTALCFAQNGASLYLNARKEGVLDDFSKELSEKYNVEVTPVYFDVTDVDQVKDVFQMIFKKSRKLDVLVNNAGILDDSLIGMTTSRQIEDTFSVNTFAVLYACQYASRLMSRNKSGSIINLSSIIGTNGNSGQAVYGASKAAVIGITKSLSKELAQSQIRVNAVAPGFIDTDMARSIPQEKFEERLQSVAMGKIGRPQDIANTILFLASDLSSYVTGQVIGVDGGMLI